MKLLNPKAMKRLLFIIAFTLVLVNAEAQIASFIKQGNYLYERYDVRSCHQLFRICAGN